MHSQDECDKPSRQQWRHPYQTRRGAACTGCIQNWISLCAACSCNRCFANAPAHTWKGLCYAPLVLTRKSNTPSPSFNNLLADFLRDKLGVLIYYQPSQKTKKRVTSTKLSLQRFIINKLNPRPLLRLFLDRLSHAHATLFPMTLLGIIYRLAKQSLWLLRFTTGSSTNWGLFLVQWDIGLKSTKLHLQRSRNEVI